MVTLDLSRVDGKAQGPLELVSYWSFWSHLKPQTKAQLSRPKWLTQLEISHYLLSDIKERNYENGLKTYVRWKEKEISFSPQGEKEGFFFESLCTKGLIERPHILGTMWNWDEDWRYSQVWFWNSLHQGTLSILWF